jgi:hypothetical protein
MKNQATWAFPLDRGTAMPRDRECMPGDFDIPHGTTSMYPVQRGSQQFYLSYDERNGGRYMLSPYSGDSFELDKGTTEKQLLQGLLVQLPARTSSHTLFNRIMLLPEHLHEAAIEFVAHRRLDSIYENQEDLLASLRGMNLCIGAKTQRGISVNSMVRELSQAPLESRPKMLKNFRKQYPEPWIEDARKAMSERAIAKAKAPDLAPAGGYEFNF